MRHSICCGTTNHGMKRICIYPKDIARITGMGLRKAQKLLQNIRFIYNKQKHQYITKKELADHLGIDEKDIELD